MKLWGQKERSEIDKKNICLQFKDHYLVFFKSRSSTACPDVMLSSILYDVYVIQGYHEKNLKLRPDIWEFYYPFHSVFVTLQIVTN